MLNFNVNLKKQASSIMPMSSCSVVGDPEFDPCLCPSLAARSWVSLFSSLSHSFLSVPLDDSNTLLHG